MPMKKIKELFIKYKEIIMYLIFGVATTGVNWVVYSLLMKAVLVHAPGSDDVKMTVSNVIAWIAAVIFAFITSCGCLRAKAGYPRWRRGSLCPLWPLDWRPA